MRWLAIFLALAGASCELLGFYDSPPNECHDPDCGDVDAAAGGDSDTDADSDGDGDNSPDADVDVDADVDTDHDGGTNRYPDAGSDAGAGCSALGDPCPSELGEPRVGHCDADLVCRTDATVCALDEYGNILGMWLSGECCRGCSDDGVRCLLGHESDPDSCGTRGSFCVDCAPYRCREGVYQPCGAGEPTYATAMTCNNGYCSELVVGGFVQVECCAPGACSDEEGCL